MTVELITTWQELSALEAPWNALAGGMPLRSWDWLATWWKHYGSSAQVSGPRRAMCGVGRPAHNRGHRTSARQLYVLAIYDRADGQANSGERRLLGIAPWYLDRTIVQGNVLRWLGSGEVCTDHLSLICRPENNEHVAQGLAEALTTSCDEWDQLELSAVDADDSGVGALVAALEERDCLATRREADACWIIELPASWDDYLAALSGSHRGQLRRLQRRVLDSPRVAWHRAKTAADLEVAWRVLVDLHQRRRRSLGEPGCFASRPFHDFHREVAARLLAWGQLRLSWVELDGEPVAADYEFSDDRTVYGYQGGIDPGRLHEEPGRLSTILCLRQAIDEGYQRFDFLRGDESYKAHWGATPRATYDYRVTANRRLARLRGRVLNLSGAVTDWVRQTTQP